MSLKTPQPMVSKSAQSHSQSTSVKGLAEIQGQNIFSLILPGRRMPLLNVNGLCGSSTFPGTSYPAFFSQSLRECRKFLIVFIWFWLCWAFWLFL